MTIPYAFTPDRLQCIQVHDRLGGAVHDRAADIGRLEYRHQRAAADGDHPGEVGVERLLPVGGPGGFGQPGSPAAQGIDVERDEVGLPGLPVCLASPPG
ncbi:hypothetical protein [Nocardia flavorosea]|uniref:hypothetical protein n=1 Tax=Nocardia flavorosea TaxID=53429 RepID=UPI0024578C93|nr:hypothetical protein [Nocardia flavorosea]